MAERPNIDNLPDDRSTMDRRDFLKRTSAAVAGLGALAAALSPLRHLDSPGSLDEFLQRHYKELTPEDMKLVLERISKQVEREYEVRPHLRDVKPMDGVQFAMALNLTRCVGCRKCVHACVEENNQSRSPEIQYIRVLEMPHGTMDMEQGNHDYDVEQVPREGNFYMPVQCQQCANPPCVKVCPVRATWQEPDGIVVVDYNWCIGCRYCAAACPYWARKFNWLEPNLPTDEINPDTHYLGNRPRYKGVMEKCTFCITRVRKGLNPACHDICPTGSRKFGNLLDAESVIRKVIDQKRIYILKEEVGTDPSFYYFFD